MVNHTPTFADVCSAIAEGHLPVAVDGPVYKVNAFELRHYLNKLRPLPSISSAVTQDPSPHSDSADWSSSAQTSVA